MKTLIAKRKELEIKAANLIEKKIRDYLKTQNHIVFAIPGGSSVIRIFILLKSQPIPWHKVHIFMVDERLVPIDSPDNNFGQAEKAFISYLVHQNKIPKQNLHPYIYFNLKSGWGLEAYKKELREFSHCYDIALLSSGEDGHIASLFPNHETIKDTSEFFIITEKAPKNPARRMSSSLKLLQKSKTALLLFLGESKRKTYQKFNDKKLSVNDCPAKLVRNIEDSYIFTDIFQ